MTFILKFAIINYKLNLYCRKGGERSERENKMTNKNKEKLVDVTYSITVAKDAIEDALYRLEDCKFEDYCHTVVKKVLRKSLKDVIRSLDTSSDGVEYLEEG